MPIPETMAWPPPELDVILPAMRRWDAWYAGRTDRLEEIYRDRERPSIRRDGVLGTVQRWFWGTGDREVPHKVHAPIAARICRASADLLFAEPPVVTSGDEKSQERLDLIIGAGAVDQLASAAEVGAALGGTYMRVVWDVGLEQHPFLTRVDADQALPEFRWGRLSAVTFWRTVRTEGAVIWRHLERHETDAQGIGVIEHALFRGTGTQLGRRVSLTESPATAGLAQDGEGMGAVVSTLSPGLDVVYVPNTRPNSAWRNHPLGANLGRSDLDGVEGLLDQYDQVWTSWMRDIRLGKARIIASRQALDDHGPGKGASLDLDREVYEAVNTPPGAANTQSGMPLEHVQFNIRVQEHKDTTDALLRLILLSVGYSASTFGVDGEGGLMTATEVHSRERDSFMSRDRKIRAWRPALEQLSRKALAIDREVFRSGADPDAPVTVEFGDSVQESPEALARTMQLQYQAQAASVRTRVQTLHPDWDDQAVDAEVDAIQTEFGEPAPDPDTLGRGGYALAGYGQDDDAGE